MATDLMPQFAFDKLNWFETVPLNTGLALGCILIFLSMLPVELTRAIRNRRLSGDRKAGPRGAHLAQWIILGVSILNLLFVVGFAQWGMPISVLHSFSLIAKIVLGLGVISAVLTVGALVYTVLAWKDRYWGLAFRIYYTLVTVAAVAFVWFLNYWNLLGWRY
jgi:hypothetical protein